MVTIYHNPRCSKSRKTLEILRERGVEHRVVEYLRTPPDAAGIQELASRLGLPVSALLRTGESVFKEARDLPDQDDEAALAAWLAAHPIVLQRPIVVSDDGRAVIGRPPENVGELLD